MSDLGVTPNGLLLGGRLRPAGVAVSFLRASFEAVAEHLQLWREGLGQTLVVRDSSFGDVVSDLEPFEAPWTREVVYECGEWTAYMNNGRHGGDPTAAAPYLADSMNVECFVAVNAPRYGPGHQQTSLQILGPGGDPPLKNLRSITADCADGRWTWDTIGPVQSFEHPERYLQRTIRERFDRQLLVDYLAAVGIRADDEDFYGQGRLLVQQVNYDRVQLSAEQVRADLRW